MLLHCAIQSCYLLSAIERLSDLVSSISIVVGWADEGGLSLQKMRTLSTSTGLPAYSDTGYSDTVRRGLLTVTPFQCPSTVTVSGEAYSPISVHFM